ncbi:hypothetical protein B0J11DRAFT_509352 [Dendryphion nanum]|uniref:Uncharacterized protein n=1 Tax=Dendryphion nanum TaxID=256645 RepID=A0A9P9DBZ5_9PLEO|nr:hypothetical protein B0J11DRAFT_509352 [Dendryphion nanum]
MLSIFYLVLLAQAALVSSITRQQVISKRPFMPWDPHVDVEGHNHAYYTQVERKDQLFRITDLSIYPDPPALNEHNFVLVAGSISHDYPGLKNATLKISGVCPDYYEIEKRIDELRGPIVRRRVLHGYEYGGPLRKWHNEMFYDLFWPWWGPEPLKKSNCSVEVTAKLPDERILFSFATNFTAQWPPSKSEGLMLGRVQDKEAGTSFEDRVL